jgi:hypothetical protein
MCRAAISAATIAGVCSSCPLYHMKSGCSIDLIACPQCGYHSLPQEHGAPGGNGAAVAATAPAIATTAAAVAPGDHERRAARPPAVAECSGAMRLSEVPAGTSVRLLGFNGVDDNYLGRLTAYGMLPGVTMRVLQRFPAIILGVYQAELALETELAEGVWVLPE